MQIPPFPRTIEITDPENLIRTRLSQRITPWPDQAIPLLGYMCNPNDPRSRVALENTIRTWLDVPKGIPPKLARIQHEWLRVADIFHNFCDLIEGQHQQRRGGGSIGKAISLVAAIATSSGTGDASLWKHWVAYKDVAQFVTAAVLICRVARRMYLDRPFGEFGLDLPEILPLHMAWMLPDLVLAIGLDFERRGLDVIPHARTEPTLDPNTLWRAPPNINVMAYPAPIRPLSTEHIVVLNGRRAGNRGKGEKAKTTPVLAERSVAPPNSR
jgi:hypothetical protein